MAPSSAKPYIGGGVTEADLTADLKSQLQEVLGDRYRIERELAGGGMSRVFVAEEVELERKVVVKVLPPDLGAGLNIDRFRREIQLAAKLQHPHIVPLLAGGAQGALLYYTMPFIEGESLREKLAKSRELPVHDAVKILIEIADALAYAHTHSVVHRDIKPENVLMAGKHAVVTDFGVARALSNSTGASSLTSMGVALGTPAYMAPEQAAADPNVDHRADIYALGVVGYELLAGRTPFAGLTPQMMLSAQVTTAPEPVTKFRPNVPPQLAAVIMQCLEKNPADRLQSAEEVRARLEAMSTPSGGMEPVAGRSYSKPGFRLTPQRIGVLAAVVGFAGVALFAASTAFRGADEPFTIGSTRQLTSETGLELHPVISPDGKTIAYVSGTPGRMSLFIRQAGGGRAVRLTEESQGDVSWPIWSHDGTRIAYTSEDRIFSIPALGGRPSVLVSSGAERRITHGGWSPDGTRFVHAVGDTVFVAAADGSGGKAIGTVSGAHAMAWSPDGSRIAIVSGDDRFLLGSRGTLGNVAASTIWVLSADGGEPAAATDSTNLRTSPVWSADGRHLLYVSAAGGVRDIYQQRVDGSGRAQGAPIRLTTGLNPHSISLSRDGRLLTYSQFVMTSNVYAVSLARRGAVTGDALRPVTSGNQMIEALAVSADGQWLAYDSNLGGNQDIYKIPIAGGEAEQLTRDPADDFQPAWSADGKEILFHGFRNGTRDLFVVTADGSATTELLRTPTQEFAGSWSPAGNAVVFGNRVMDGRDAFVSIAERSANGEWKPARNLVVAIPTVSPRWSHDGKLIVFSSADGLSVISPSGGSPRLLYKAGPDYPRAGTPTWSRDSRTIYYVTTADVPALWSVPATGGIPTRLLTFPDPARQPFRALLDVHGDNAYVTIGSRESDVWIMDLVQK